MTKPVEPGSVEDAVAKTIALLSWPEAVKISGRKRSMVYAWRSEDDDRQLPFAAALAFDLAMQERGFGHPFLDILSSALSATPSGRAGGCALTELGALTARLGDLARSVTDAMADGTIDVHERRNINGKVYDLIDQARAINEAIEPPGPHAVATR